jgi:histidinol phosphatase-like enzyme|tara:strand:+ start:1633 stop:1926 length:294 start_codon:yes stop_codon:yes gene_type:complete
MIIYVDIDGTICDTPQNPRDYSKATPRKEIIEKVNKLYDDGNTVVYWTARGGSSKIDWSELTRSQLRDWGARYTELRTDKPPYDVFYDDKAEDIDSL